MPQLVNGTSVNLTEQQVIQQNAFQNDQSPRRNKGGIQAKNYLKITGNTAQKLSSIYANPQQHIRQMNLGKKYDKNKALKVSYREKIDKLQK